MTRSQNANNLWTGLRFTKGLVFFGCWIFILKQYFPTVITDYPPLALGLLIAFGICAFGAFIFLFFLWLFPKVITTHVNSRGGRATFYGDPFFEQFAAPFYIEDA